MNLSIDQSALGHGTRLCGNQHRFGFEVFYYNLTSPQPFECTHLIRPNTLEICINVEGIAMIQGKSLSKIFSPEKVFHFLTTNSSNTFTTRRLAGKHHFISIYYSLEWIQANTHEPNHKNTLPTEPQELPWGDEIGEIVDIATLTLDTHESIRLPTLTHQLLVRIFKQDYYDATRQSINQTPDRFKRIPWVKEYLRTNMIEPLSLKTLATLVDCTPSHLSHTFSKVEGITISKYLQKIRLNHARRRLSEKNLSITDVALETGYQSLSHFSQIFHKDQGCTPLAYRRRFW